MTSGFDNAAVLTDAYARKRERLAMAACVGMTFTWFCKVYLKLGLLR